MTLIPEAKRAWRMFSLQANALNAAVLSTWALLPEGLQAKIPQSWVVGIAIGLLVIGTVGRLVKQDSVSGPTEENHG